MVYEFVYTELYILLVYTFRFYPPWVKEGSRSGLEVLRTRRWAQFWPFFNYMQGVKEIGGKEGGWMACENPLMTIQPS